MVDGEGGVGGDLALIGTFFVVVLVGTFASQVCMDGACTCYSLVGGGAGWENCFAPVSYGQADLGDMELRASAFLLDDAALVK